MGNTKTLFGSVAEVVPECGAENPTAVNNLVWIMLPLVGEGWTPRGKRSISRQHMAKQCCVVPPSPDGVPVFLEGMEGGEKLTNLFW